MAERTEEQLARALKAAADLAPEPPADLAQCVAARRRRRDRRRLQTALAVTGVVAVIGTGMTVVKGAFVQRHDEAATEPAATASVTATPRVTPTIAPAAKVWPDAVFRMPAKAPDGAAYRPVTALGPTQVLLAAERSMERAVRLEVYDTTTGTTTVLAKVPTPQGLAEYYVQAWDADERYIVWYATADSRRDGPVAMFWAVPREGGTPRLVYSLSGDQAAKVERVAIAGDRIAYSLSTGGVYTLPLDRPFGDADGPELIEGSEGLYLQQWPWAGDRPGQNGTDPARNQTLIVNLETGERRIVRAGDAQGVRCGATWCAGERYGEPRDDGRPRAVVQRYDGAERRELESLRAAPSLDGIVADRFAVLSVSAVPGRGAPEVDASKEPHPVAVVYDRVTGAMAAVGSWDKDGTGGFGRGTSSAPSDIVYWNAPGRPKEYWVLNLAAVP
jgi:hypothetical protein